MLGLNAEWCWKASRSKKTYLGPAALNASKISSSRGLRSHELSDDDLNNRAMAKQSFTSASVHVAPPHKPYDDNDAHKMTNLQASTASLGGAEAQTLSPEVCSIVSASLSLSRWSHLL
jgi:hypothetical protein